MTTLLSGQTYWGAAAGLLVLLGVFVAAVVWMFRPGAASEYRRAAELPLDDGTRKEAGARDR